MSLEIPSELSDIRDQSTRAQCNDTPGNDTPADTPPLTVHGLFWHQAGGPESDRTVAIVHGDRTVTYQDLGRKAGQIAADLRAAGVAPGDTVALYLPRTPELFAGMLGVLTAGACYLPVDTADPDEHLRRLFEQARVTTFVTDGARVPPGATSTARVLTVDPEIPAGPPGPPPEPVPVGPDAAAYCMFTSGSTGRPKGVAMTHGALVNLLCWHDRVRPGSCQSRTAQACSVTFDFSFHEIFSTLCFGGALVIADDHVRRNAFALSQFLVEAAIERLFLPVTSLAQLAEAAFAQDRPMVLADVITTGERLRVTPAMVGFFRRTGARLHNHYGATEFQDATTCTLSGDPEEWPQTVPIGRPIDNVRVYIADSERRPVPAGGEGELYVAGAGVAAGYLNQPELTAQRFVPGAFGEGRVYRTGDLARLGPDGMIEHLGRLDEQVKIRGIRVEPGEIEARLREHPAVRDVAVVPHEVRDHNRLVAHVVLRDRAPDRATADGVGPELHRYLAAHLQPHLLPEAYVVLDEMPLTSSGKTDRRRLVPPSVFPRLLDSPVDRPGSATEQILAQVFATVLQLDAVGTQDNFFDIGGTSLHLIAVHRELERRMDRTADLIKLDLIDLYRYPTIRALAEHLDLAGRPVPSPARAPRRRAADADRADIAIIGIACRFPGANDPESFWHNLRDGVESVTPVAMTEIEQTDADLVSDHRYVTACAFISDIEQFDAEFFDINAKEASMVDPQQRVFLECCWEAFENAGYIPGPGLGAVGVFAGSSISTYLTNNLGPHFGYPARGPLVEADMLQFQLKLGNDRNYLPARVSYKLNLTGPSVNVQTACSTSLVAVHLACRSLRAGESELALAGGVSLIVPQKCGYLWEEGMVRSRDGHCRAFDAAADGTLFGNGCGVVLLKRLDQARSDRDRVIAVIKGSAVNNDGSAKVGFTAPSADRQAAVVRDALADAGVDAGTIGLVEAHGTATAIGDPIEIAALNQAFGDSSAGELPARSCAVGSVKTNIGHLDEAAGVAGLIKAALALRHQTLPPSLHFERPNPRIDFDAGPFFVNTALTRWAASDGPRRAGVSSFGMGGTNCHVVLEEARDDEARPAGQPGQDFPYLLALSGRTPAALRDLAGRYEALLAAGDDLGFADICWTAAVGRRNFSHRFAAVARTAAQARSELTDFLAGQQPPSGPGGPVRPGPDSVAFVFSGQGSQYAGMGREVYRTQPVVRSILDRCAELLADQLERPLLDVLFAPDGGSAVDDTAYAQPGLFAVEYALAELWESWGVRPAVVTGHSLGEYVAACRAGVFGLPDALALVAARGRLMSALPPGGRMVSVAADEATVAELIAPYYEHVSLAAVNGSRSCVISGGGSAITTIIGELAHRGVRHRELTVSHAFHSPLMRPMLSDFARVAESVRYSRPTLPVVSNIAGEVVGDEMARAGYWVDHVMRPVRFADCVAALSRLGASVFVEISPRPTLSHLISEQLPGPAAAVVPSMRPEREYDQLLRSAAELYTSGLPVDLAQLFQPGRHRRVPLPGYPWQRQRHWVDPPAGSASSGAARGKPLIGRRMALPDSSEIRFESTIGPRQLSWLADHRVFQSIVMPGVAFIEMAWATGREAFGTDEVILRDFFIGRAMTFPGESAERQAHIVLRPTGPDAYDAQVFSRIADGTPEPWAMHASGRLERSPATSPAPAPRPGRLTGLRAGFEHEIDVSEIYRGEHEREIDLGAAFWATERLWKDGLSSLSEICLPAQLQPEASGYQIHPVLIEACFLALTVTYPENYGRRTYVPVGVDELSFHSLSGTRAWCHARLRAPDTADPETLRADIDLFDAAERTILTMKGVVLKRARRQAMLRQPEPAAAAVDVRPTAPLYRTTWEPQPVPDSTGGGNWLILSAGPIGAALAEAAGRRGVRATVADAGAAASVADFTALMDRAPACDLVVAGWPADTGGPQDAAAALRLSTQVLYLVQALAGRPGSTPALGLVTSGAQPVADRLVASPAQAALWGLGRVIRLEQAVPGFAQVDLDPADPAAGHGALLAAELLALTESGEDQVGYRGGRRHIARLARAAPPGAGSSGRAVRADASYLITGGLGGLGLEAAGVLSGLGARHLILVGRNAPGPAADAVLDQLRASGTQVVTMTADVALEASVADCLDQIANDAALPPLRGVLHLAGVLDDGILRFQDRQRFERVLAPKAAGAWHLHGLTTTCPLDFFVLFSSVSALLGTGGQGGYAAANAFLDGLASYRRSLGLPGLAVQWGSWAQVGISARRQLDATLERTGEGVIAREQGRAVLAALLDAAPPENAIAVLPVNWPRFLDQLIGPMPFLSDLRPAAARQQTFRSLLDAALPERRRTLLATQVRTQVVRSLGTEAGLGPDTGFVSLGLDSLSSIELRNRLQADLACQLTPTVIFDYPTLTTLIDHLADVLAPTDELEETARNLARKLGLP